MAVTATNLHCVKVTGFHKEFMYDSTGEAMSTIVAANYFTAASLTNGMLKENDRVTIFASDGNGTFKVTSNGTTAALIPDGPIKTVTSIASTGTALNPFGVNYISCTGSLNYTLTPPGSIGDRVTAILTGASTGTATITTTGAILDPNGTTNTVITLADGGDGVTLEAMTTSIWAQVAAVGTVDGTSITAKVWQPSS